MAHRTGEVPTFQPQRLTTPCRALGSVTHAMPTYRPGSFTAPLLHCSRPVSLGPCAWKYGNNFLGIEARLPDNSSSNCNVGPVSAVSSSPARHTPRRSVERRFRAAVAQWSPQPLQRFGSRCCSHFIHVTLPLSINEPNELRSVMTPGMRRAYHADLALSRPFSEDCPVASRVPAVLVAPARCDGAASRTAMIGSARLTVPQGWKPFRGTARSRHRT